MPYLISIIVLLALTISGLPLSNRQLAALVLGLILIITTTRRLFVRPEIREERL